MNLLPLLIGLFLFLSKNSSSPVASFLKQIDVKEVISLLKELGVAPEVFSLLSDDTIDKILQGQLELKNLLPVIIKLLSAPKEKPKKISPLDSFATGEIKASLYSYLNK